MKNWTGIQKLLFVLGALSLVTALFFHSYLANRHYQVGLGLSVEESFCNVSDKFNCDVVNTSGYSKLFGIPISLWGFYTNLAALLLLFFYLKSKEKIQLKFLYHWSHFMLLTSVAMGVISLFLISTYCLFCIFLYVLSFIFFISLRVVWGAPKLSELFSDFGQVFKTGKVVLLLILLIPVGAKIHHDQLKEHYQKEYQRQLAIANPNIKQHNHTDHDGHGHQNTGNTGNTEKDLNNFLVQMWSAQKYYDFNYTGALTTGASDEEAVMVITEFADFLCPHCSQASNMIEEFFENNSESVQWNFLHFPMDGACNPYMRRKKDASCKMAKAMVCISGKENAWKAHKDLFKKQRQMSTKEKVDEILGSVLTSNGFNKNEVYQCIQSEETQKIIEQHVKQGAENKLTGTPAIFVNGKRLQRGQFPSVLEAVMNEL